MLTTPLLKTNQSNSTPTEAQVKLAIAQVLSLPSVYNSPVFILDFKIDDKEVVTGRFRDARKPRVFSYEIADDGITFKPFVPGRMDGFDVKFWEDFSAGYSYRIDAVAKKRTEKPKCKEGVSYPCGKSCISLKKNCKTNPQDPVSKARRQKLKNTVEEVQKAKGGVAAPTKTQEDNKLTPKSPKEVELTPNLEVQSLPSPFIKRMEKAGYQKKRLSIDNTSSGEILVLDVMAKGDVAIHPDYGKGTDKILSYSVTHIPSGKKVYAFNNSFGESNYTLKRSENDAIQLADLLQSSDLKNKELNSDQLHDISVKLHQVRYGVDKETAEKEVGTWKKPQTPQPIPTVQRSLKTPEETRELSVDFQGNQAQIKALNQAGSDLLSQYTEGVSDKNILLEGIKDGRVSAYLLGETLTSENIGNYKTLADLAKERVGLKREARKRGLTFNEEDPNDRLREILGKESGKAIAETKTTSKASKPKVVDPLSLTPEPQKTPEPIAKTPKLIGDGTHEGMPKNAQEYYDMVTKSGRKITKEEAEGTIKAIEKWGLDSTHVRDVQKAGKSSKEEQYITDFINNSTPYKGELYRGLSIYMDDPRDLIKVGQPLGNQGAHASWTSKPQVAEHFAGMSDDYHYSVVIKSINNKTGASIRKITEEWQGGFMGMEEVIVPKNAKHIVRSIEERKDGVYFVVVEEI